MKKGCAIAAGTAASLMVLAIGGCIYIAEQYGKEHPELQQAADSLHAAELEVVSFKGDAAHGNNDEARAIAKQFSVALKAAREIFFTGSDKSKVSLTDGQFVTYCQLLPDKCAVLVHVPQLRNYSTAAESEMANMAWRMAVNVLRTQTTPPKELAVGIRGPISYGKILVGAPPASGDAMPGIQKRTTDSSVLFPFFAPPVPKPKSSP